MRVRQLQAHLQETNLIHTGQTSSLKDLKIGIDAAYWLRSIPKLKDPFADALGGIPPGLYGMLERELDHFKKLRITPVFVFEGITPSIQNQAYQLSAIQTQLDTAWTHIAKKQRQEAQKVFAVSTSRINADIEHIIFHHLKAMGHEVMRAPYFVGAQLSHLSEVGSIQAAVGPPGLLLYGVPRVVLSLDFQKQTFEWADMEMLLQQWGLERDQFIDACLLAGTEYCLTYPYLNVEFENQTQQQFQFEFAIEFIKKMKLINWMNVFPSEEMKLDHVNGYCISKVLLQSTPVLHTIEEKIRPLNDRAVPSDFTELVGSKLPSKLYMLLCSGILSKTLPGAIASARWLDREPPLIDSQEYRQLVLDLFEYRSKSLGLILQWVEPEHLKSKPISSEVYWERNTGAQLRTLTPFIPVAIKWSFTRHDLEEEKHRQGTEVVDLKFCLKWHAHMVTGCDDLKGKFGTVEPNGPPRAKGEIADVEVALAMTQLLLLESLELIGEDGDMTVLGDVLKDCPPEHHEACLFALELMKFGVLTEQPFEEVEDRKFPLAIQYPKGQHQDDTIRAKYLISRIMSLRPMKLHSTMWDAQVDFDLAAFHAHVRVLKRTLRELTEACLCNVMLQDPSHADSLRDNLLNPSDSSRHDGAKALLPTFMLPRTCMGIVWKYLLDYNPTGEVNKETLKAELRTKFACTQDPVTDIQKSIVFWREVHRCVAFIAEPLGVTEFAASMDHANKIVEAKCKQFGLVPESG